MNASTTIRQTLAFSSYVLRTKAHHINGELDSTLALQALMLRHQAERLSALLHKGTHGVRNLVPAPLPSSRQPR